MAYGVKGLRDAKINMEKSMYKQFGNYQTGTVKPMRGYATNLLNKTGGMMNDPSKLGYSPETKGLMFGRQADALSGARATFGKENNRQVAAQGLSNTGQAMRNQMQYDTGYASNLRAAGRDVELADAEAKRSDTWNAINAYGNAIGTYGDVGKMQLAGMGAEQDYWNSDVNAGQAYVNASLGEENANNAGFWGSFKRSAGAGLGKTIFG
jgi:hypothetical protein